MSRNLLHKRRKTHQRVIWRFCNGVAMLTSFLVIFSVLLTLSNWSAYSQILQDIIDPEAMASQQLYEQEQQQKAKERQRELEQLKLQINPDTDYQAGEGKSFSLEDMGQLYPNEMRLEVPKVFSGTVPVRDVDVEDFDFKDLYSSENKIQQALKGGVVHYPYTADPHEFGNVFITGHSSYLPWDSGRYKDIFALLHKLELGDEYSIYYGGKKYTYQVNKIFEVEPHDVSVLDQPVDQKMSTLMTCTPVGTTLRRLIVQADLVRTE